jgi:hypothetical protein
MFVYVYFAVIWSLSWTPWTRGLAWEGDRHSAGKVVLRLLWKPNFRYRINKSSLLGPILNTLNPATISRHIKIHFSIIISFNSRASRWVFFHVFQTKFVSIFYCLYSCYMSTRNYSLDLIALLISDECKLWSSLVCVSILLQWNDSIFCMQFYRKR